MKAEDAAAAEKEKAAEAVSLDLEGEFAEVNAACEAALDQVAALTQAELAAVRYWRGLLLLLMLLFQSLPSFYTRGAKAPTPCLRLNLEAYCILRGVKPDRVPDATAGQTNYSISHKMFFKYKF